MKPRSIPEDWLPEGVSGQKITVSGPEDSQIEPVEALVVIDEEGIANFALAIELEDGDLQSLAIHNMFVVKFAGAIVPFGLDVLDITEEEIL